MRSVYFGQRVKSEQQLYEDIISEAFNVMGHDMFYLPRTIVSQDKLLNEDIESQFNTAFTIPMYIESVDGYEGDGVLMSKFGLEVRNQLRIAVSRRTWEKNIGKWNKGFNNYRPSEGDLIYISGVNGIFEIRYVNLESPFHQLNNLPVYKMTCELFEYRGENLDTGVPEVDKVQNLKSLDMSYRATITYAVGSTARLKSGESVTVTFTSGVTGTGKVTRLTLADDADPTGILTATITALRYTDGSVHNLAVGCTLTGAESGAVATISGVINLLSGDDALSDGDVSIQNNPFESRANDLLDFSVTNPFGGSPTDS